MPIQSRIEINIDEDQFKSLHGSFLKYAEALEKTQTSWMKAGLAGRSVVSQAGDVLRAVEAQLDSMTSLLTGHDSFLGSARSAGNVFAKLARDTKGVAENLVHATASLVSIATLAGALGGILGAAGGLFGVDELSHGAMARRRSALGLGLSYGQFAAYDVNFGRLGNPSEFLGGVASGTYDVTSGAYMGLLQAGINPRTSDTSTSAIELLKRLPALMQGVPDSQLLPFARTRHWTDILSPETIILWRHMSQGERGKRLGELTSDSQKLNVSDAALQAWADLSQQLSRSGEIISKIFVSNLPPVVDGLTHLSTAVVKMVDNLVHSPDMARWMKKAAGGIAGLDKWLTDPATEKGFKSFLDGLHNILPVIERVLRLALVATKVAGTIAGDPQGAGDAVADALGLPRNKVGAGRPDAPGYNHPGEFGRGQPSPDTGGTLVPGHTGPHTSRMMTADEYHRRETSRWNYGNIRYGPNHHPIFEDEDPDPNAPASPSPSVGGQPSPPVAPASPSPSVGGQPSPPVASSSSGSSNVFVFGDSLAQQLLLSSKSWAGGAKVSGMGVQGMTPAQISEQAWKVGASQVVGRKVIIAAGSNPGGTPDAKQMEYVDDTIKAFLTLGVKPSDITVLGTGSRADEAPRNAIIQEMVARHKGVHFQLPGATEHSNMPGVHMDDPGDTGRKIMEQYGRPKTDKDSSLAPYHRLFMHKTVVVYDHTHGGKVVVPSNLAYA